jgi:hypothetical protein
MYPCTVPLPRPCWSKPPMYGCPWAQIWMRFCEKDMQRPEEEDIFSFE